jgi:alkylmercury lyase
MSTTDKPQATEAIRKLIRAGGMLDYGHDLSRLLLRVLRSLSKSQAVFPVQINQIIEEIGITREDAYQLLAQVAERGTDDAIVGLLGLSLNETQHHFEIGGKHLFTWCALDTLFLPGLLGQPANVESESPVSGAKIRLTVSPRGADAVDPADAVVSIVVVDPDAANLGSVEAIWSTFCHHVFFFANRRQAEQWVAERDYPGAIEILSVAEAFEVGRQLSSSLLNQAGER